jgi:membrane protein implicated in regulation of membrane protease activity
LHQQSQQPRQVRFVPPAQVAGSGSRATYHEGVDAWAWWLIGAVALGVVEVLTLDLIFAMLGAGALAAAGVAAGTGADGAGAVSAQALVALVVALAGLVFLRPVALRHLKNAPELRTGTAALEGTGAVVLERVDPAGGRVKLAGEVWSARSYDGFSVFEPGDAVSVARIDGATALVL